MPEFKVTLTRTITQVATVIVEAGTPAGAGVAARKQSNPDDWYQAQIIEPPSVTSVETLK